MRKISILKKLGIGLAPVAIATPLIFTTTSCSKNEGILVNYISYNKFQEDESLDHMSHGHFDNDELLLGSKKFFNGNYIMFVGSNAYPSKDLEPSSTAKFFGATDGNRNIHNWFTEFLHDSVWYRDVQSTNILNDINRKFGFVTFLDNFNFRFFDKHNHEIFITGDASKGPSFITTAIGPFDTWERSDVSIEQTRKLMKDEFDYEWDKKEKVKTTDFIRQDAQAKAFRAFVRRGAKMFPTTDARTKTFDTSVNNTTGQMIVYKDGRLVDIIDLPTVENKKPEDTDKETTTLFGTINKYYTEEDEE